MYYRVRAKFPCLLSSLPPSVSTYPSPRLFHSLSLSSHFLCSLSPSLASFPHNNSHTLLSPFPPFSLLSFPPFFLLSLPSFLTPLPTLLSPSSVFSLLSLPFLISVLSFAPFLSLHSPSLSSIPHPLTGRSSAGWY